MVIGLKPEEGGGFFDIDVWYEKDYCTSPSHKFPTHIYIPPGKGYRHVCPACGEVSEVINKTINIMY